MKPSFAIASILALGAAVASSQGTYTNFIRQVQFPSQLDKDMSVEPSGTSQSPLATEDGGARFELWAVRNAPYTEYLLDSRYVGSFVPVANVRIETGDPYTTIPRTRADQKFTVYVTLDGLHTDEDAPAASKSVNLLHHVQSYGTNGTGENINRDNATLLEPTISLTSNIVSSTDPYGVFSVSVPASDFSQARGEERFSIYTLDDYQAPPSQIASAYVQIWPVGGGKIEGVAAGDQIKFKMTDVTLTYTNIYPDSTVYAQVYPGPPVDGTVGTKVPGSSIPYYSTVPGNPDPIVLTNWDSVFTQDGAWTMELIAETPFGPPEIIAQVGPFYLDRTIQVNSGITTTE
jgi:hypothetical protein